jgi:hypothetical protein
MLPCFLHADYLHRLLRHLEDGGSIFFRNFGLLPPFCTETEHFKPELIPVSLF